MLKTTVLGMVRGWRKGLLGGAFASLVALVPEAEAQVSTSWVEPCVENLVEAEILEDVPDRLNVPMTRAEFARTLDRTLERTFPEIETPRETRFTDVATNSPEFEAIARLERRGFWESFLDLVFGSDRKLARWEMWVALTDGLDYRAAQTPRSLLDRTYRDAILVPPDIEAAIAAATERQIVVVSPSGEDAHWLYPYRLATRADVAATMCLILAKDGFPNSIPEEYAVRVTVPEIRGVWLTNVDSEVLFSRRELRQAIDRLHRLNFNTLYPTVWNWGYTLYPSAVAEPVIGRAVDPEPGLQRYDMLAEAIEYGHRKGLRVIPWFEFGFQAPSYSELARRNPDWLTQRSDGSQTIMEGEHERVWLNPFHPEVQQFILDLLVEIASNYDIDGIQLDDHLGLPVEFGYDAYTVELYRSEHDGAAPPEDYTDPDWIRWRADKITEFVGRAFRAVKAVNPDAVFSVSPNPQHFAYSRYLQDWESWERIGYIEELVLQVYRDDIDVFAMELQRPEVEAARHHIPVGIAILTGLKNRPIELDLIRQKVRKTRELGFSGMSFFFYESLWNWAEDPPEVREGGFAELFPEAVVAPDVID
ncbi:glycoside hydrolase family 10 protein [Baaleninema simplex]|uniref:glycoside hydrolase family 10 protein n=1 Tax=Baaleninema simplex TaxID=2862350 RepID=UPI00035EAE82|nr:glycoside hydrolase family 10 protein [Baaleninema simplex]